MKIALKPFIVVCMMSVVFPVSAQEAKLMEDTSTRVLMGVNPFAHKPFMATKQVEVYLSRIPIMQRYIFRAQAITSAIDPAVPVSMYECAAKQIKEFRNSIQGKKLDHPPKKIIITIAEVADDIGAGLCIPYGEFLSTATAYAQACLDYSKTGARTCRPVTSEMLQNANKLRFESAKERQQKFDELQNEMREFVKAIEG